MKQKVLLGVSLCSLLALTGCVSEQTYVGSDKPVSDRSFDNIEAARTRISLGLNYLRRGDTSQAKYNLERARSFAPNSAEVHSALAYYYQTVGEHKQAEEYFRTAISKDVNYADAYNNYGAFLCQLKRYDEAEQLLLKAVSRPGYIRVAESYENLALCQLQQDSFAKASNYLDSSLSHNATRISSLTLAAGLAYAMGNTSLAQQRLDRIQRLGRVSARTVLLSYLIADKTGDNQVKRNAEQLLLTLYTETPETRLLLQNKTADSEFEMLRERYKDSLMANIVVPDAAQPVPVPAKPVANPKLKIVKRKTADAESETVDDSFSRPRTERVNTASEIANALSANTTVAKAAAEPMVKAVEAPAVSAQVVVEPEQPTVAKQSEPAKTEIAAPVIAEPLISDTSTPAFAEPEQLTAATQPEMAETATPIPTAEQLAETVAAIKAAPLPPEQPIEQPTVAEPTELAEPAELADNATADIHTDAEQVVQSAEPELAAKAELVTPTASPTETALVDASQPDTALLAEATTQSVAEVPFHIVQAAESLYAISVKHNIRLQRLMQWNQLTPESVIKTGQKIWLGPVSEQQLQAKEAEENTRQQVVAESPYHVVASGETMFAISYRYNLRLDKFMAWNGFNEDSTLLVGQRVYVVDPETIE